MRLEVCRRVKRQKTEQPGDEGSLVSRGGHFYNVHARAFLSYEDFLDSSDLVCIRIIGRGNYGF